MTLAISEPELTDLATHYPFSREQIRAAWPILAELTKPAGEGVGMKPADCRQLFRRLLGEAASQGRRGPSSIMIDAVATIQAEDEES